MASVTLNQVWVHLGSDLTTSVQLDAPTISETPTSLAQTRRYASGNYRLISVPGTQRIVNYTFEIASRTDVETLRGWTQTLVMVRDPLGRKVFGMFPSLTITEREMADTSLVWQVTAAFSEISTDESV